MTKTSNLSRLVSPDRWLGRLVFDPCLRRGIVPSSGIPAAVFRRIGASRLIRLPQGHPLLEITSRTEWKTWFSISDQSLLWIWNFLQREQPNRIIEIGSGLSTLMFASYARTRAQSGQRVEIDSIEHDEGWLAQTQARLRELELEGFVSPHHCPVVQYDGAGATLDFPEDVRRNTYDLLLIDGPPGSVGRGGTLPSLIDNMRHGATVLVDDAWREQPIIDGWLRTFEPRIKLTGRLPLGSGLARIEIQ